MKLITRLVGLVVLCAFCAKPVLAESAPVYDADSLPPFDQGSDSRGSDVPPPPPAPLASNDQDSGFVPMQGDAESFPAEEPRRVTRSQPVVSNSPASSPSAERIRRLEQQVANLQSSEKNVKIETLQNQIQALRSEIDTLNHQLQQMQKQKNQSQNQNQSTVVTKNTDSIGDNDTPAKEDELQNKDNKTNRTTSPKKTQLVKNDVTKKTSTTEESDDSKKPTEQTLEAKAPSNTQPNVQEEQEIYQTAYNLIKSKKYTDAITSLKDMLKKYPSGQFASNAHYWLGELYGLSGKSDQALTEFSTVVRDYSESPRVAEAQLKVGLIFASQSKWPDAKTALKKVVNHYPGTTSARLASEQLKQIKDAGH